MGRRQEPRLSMVLPVKVYGSNARGEPFTQAACVTDVSRRGARIEGVQGISKVGEILVLEHGTKRAKFQVVWVGAPGTRLAGCAGLRNLEPEKAIFGVPLPAPGLDVYQVPGLAVDRRVQDRRQSERRRHPRYKCMGTVELHKEGTNFPTWAKISDICVGGCYVELMSPFPVETRVELVVNVCDQRVRTHGLVRSHHPGFGMGIAFVETKPDELAVLNRIIATLAAGSDGRPARPKVVPLPPAATPPSGRGRDASAALEALTHWFGTHDILTRGEFLRLAGGHREDEPPQGIALGTDRF